MKIHYVEKHETRVFIRTGCGTHVSFYAETKIPTVPKNATAEYLRIKEDGIIECSDVLKQVTCERCLKHQRRVDRFAKAFTNGIMR